MTLAKWFVTILCSIFISATYSQGNKYEDQSIHITNADIRKNEVRAGVKGIQLTCYAHFKYGETDISGAEENDYLKQYYFFLEIKNSENGERIFYPSHNPDQKYKESTFDEYYKVRVIEPGKYYVRVFIPYHQFQLIPGFQKANLSLSACDEKSKYFFRNLYQAEIIIDQPQTYLARITVEDAKFVEEQYDLPANKIPIIGLFAGGKKSKSGQGLPDAVWVVKVGNDVMYISEVNKNSLEVFPGTATFKISKGDPIKVIFYDEDYFKSDQELGILNFYKTQEVGKDLKRNYAFDKIESSNIVFEQTLIPAISSIVIKHETTKFNGVTGIIVTALYVMNGIQKNDAILTRPVFRDKNGQTHIPEFIKLTDTNLVVGKNGYPLNNRNGAEKQQFFIPHYSCFTNMYPGVEFIMDKYMEVIQSGFSKQKLPKFESVNNDVIATIGGVEENKYNGFWGLKFPLVMDIPEMYYEDLKFTDVSNSIKIMQDDTLDITSKVQLISLFGDTSLGQFNLRKIRNDKYIHIPYSPLHLENKNHVFTILTSSTCLKNGALINRDTFKLSINNPQLTHVKPFRLGFRIGQKSLEKGFAKIYLGNELVANPMTDIIPKGKKYRFEIDFTAYYAHINDEIRIEIWGVDYFGHEKLLDKRILDPLQINYFIIPDYKPKKPVKGYRLRKARKSKN